MTININRLIECRLKLNLSKQAAAKKIGVSQPTYLRYESGERNPSLHVLKDMATAFNTSVDYLTGKADVSDSDYIVIDRLTNPELFQLVKRYKNSENMQISRLSEYAKKISAITLESTKLPIGIQDFVGLRQNNYLYVDKTEYIYSLVNDGKQYFLSRPRRFGKSLLLSTIKAYFEGKQELFSGLKIEQLEGNSDKPEKWKKYPVFYFDFNGQNYSNLGALEETLNIHLKRWEEEYKIINNSDNLGERFQNLLIDVSQKCKCNVVVLVDEYDKSLLETMDNPKLEEHNRNVFKAFFSSLKGYDEYIRFAFISGVTKFEKVSIFSDLNQLNDISMVNKYSGICGITQKELEENFTDQITQTSKEKNISYKECIKRLKQNYDGYRFNAKGEEVYNPFSLLKSFYDCDFGAYWFATGTPTFLVKQMQATRFDLKKLSNNDIYTNEASLSEYRINNKDIVPLLYQTGYLTIKDYERTRRRFTMAFPNEEVKYGFLECLSSVYAPNMTSGSGLDIFTLDSFLNDGDYESAMSIFKSLFAGIPYPSKEDVFEYNFQSVIYIIFELLGRFVECERHTYNGRIDCIVKYDKYIYLFEFKCDDTADNALKQIDEMGYDLPYKSDKRSLLKIGVGFDSKKRILKEWKTNTTANSGTAKSLFGILPQTATLEEAKSERHTDI